VTSGFEPDTPPYSLGATPSGRVWPRWMALLGIALVISAMIAAAVTYTQPYAPAPAPLIVPGMITTVTVR
jgi:hypothetical protein